jgi:hypothetical protein
MQHCTLPNLLICHVLINQITRGIPFWSLYFSGLNQGLPMHTISHSISTIPIKTTPLLPIVTHCLMLFIGSTIRYICSMVMPFSSYFLDQIQESDLLLLNLCIAYNRVSSTSTIEITIRNWVVLMMTSTKMMQVARSGCVT